MGAIMKQIIQRNPFPVLLCTIFIDLLGVGILIPVIPQLLANPSSREYLFSSSVSLSTAYIFYGILSALYPLAIFFAAPILGQLSDRYGRKPLLAFSLAGTCVSYVLFAIAIAFKNIPLLFASRLLDGITGGNISVAQAAIADITAPQNRAKAFGMIGAAFGMGFILGPYLGGKLSDPQLSSWFTAATPFWGAAFLSFLNALFLFFVFPETHKTRNHGLRIDWSKSVHHVVRAFSLPSHTVIFTAAFLFQAGFSFYISFFSVFLIHRFGFSQGNIGDYFAYVGIWIALTQALITRFVAARYGERSVLRLSMFGMSAAILCFFFPTVWWQLLLVTPLFAICNGLTQANLLGLISRSAPASVQGEILGVSSSVQALAAGLPPLLAGFVASRFSPEAPIIISSLIILIAGVVFAVFYKQRLAVPQHVA